MHNTYSESCYVLCTRQLKIYSHAITSLATARNGIYRMARNIGGELNLAVWQLGKRPSNLNAIYTNKDMYVLCTYDVLNLRVCAYYYM